MYVADEVSGAPVSEVKEIKVVLDEEAELIELKKTLSAEEFALVLAERYRRKRFMGPNGEIITN